MTPRLQGQNCKFSRLHCLAIPRRDLKTKKTKPNIEKWPKSLGVMLEFQYVERGLLATLETARKLGRVNFRKDSWDCY